MQNDIKYEVLFSVKIFVSIND